MKNISFDKNILYIGDKNIVFEDEIFQVKIEDDKIYVLLDIKPKEKLTYDDCNNVFCYSGKGRKIWQIGVRPKGNPTVYTMINFDDKYLYANDFMGRRYYIDKNTGEIQGMMIAKLMNKQCLLIKNISVISNFYVCIVHTIIRTNAEAYKVFVSESRAEDKG